MKWPKKFATAFLVLLVAAASMETVFGIFFLETRIPVTDAQFQKWIAFQWPRPIPFQKTEGTYRIIGLGDSFGMFGGKGNFHYLFEEQLQSQGISTEVVNFSHGGYELFDEIQLMKRFAHRYQPDLVLHSFYVGNDFSDAGSWSVFRNAWIHRPQNLPLYLKGQWSLVRWLYAWYTQHLNSIEVEEEKRMGKPTGVFSERYFPELMAGIFGNLYREVGHPSSQWEKALKRLDQIRDYAKRTGANYAVVIHPAQFQVETALWQEVARRTPNLRIRREDLDAPQRFLLDYCTRNNIPALDLLPAFQADGAEGGLYLFRNTHYNEQGNLLASRQIGEFLRKEGLVPEPTVPYNGGQ